MPSDSLTCFHIAEELNEKLCPARIERVSMPTRAEAVFTVKKDRITSFLTLSAEPVRAGIYIEPECRPAPATPFAFTMHLRKHIGGGIIERIAAMPFERVIELHIRARDELKVERSYILYLELIGRQTNILLTHENKITDCVRHAGLDENGGRVILPGVNYMTPPMQKDKLRLSNKAALIDILVGSPKTALSETLMQNLSGYAPATVKQAVFEANNDNIDGTVDAADATRLIDVFEHFYAHRSPCVTLNATGMPNEYFAFPYTHTAKTFIPYPDMSTAITAVIQSNLPDGGDKRKTNLKSAIEKKIKKNEKKAALFKTRLLTAETFDDARIYGELLTANLHAIKKGDTDVSLLNYYTGEQITIPLNHTKSPQQNAQDYYKKYAKQKREITFTNDQLNACLTETDYLRSLLFGLNSAKTSAELDEIEKEMRLSGLLPDKQKRGQKKDIKQPPRKYAVEGIHIKVGKNNLQNDALLKDAQNGYIWLHIKNAHGAHVVIEHTSPPEPVVLFAAELAAYYSENVGADKTEVDFCPIKNVKKIPGAMPGRVTYSSYQTLVVSPKEHKSEEKA